MSWLTANDPATLDPAGDGAVDLVVEPTSKDLGGFSVRRALPSARRRMVGPFVFLDHMGPALLPPGRGMDVRPHPHIGLATLTYVTQGAIFHRDSLGTRQAIEPGAVNLMVAGRGIAHSERTAPDLRAAGHTLEGLQMWLALPQAQEETDPGFAHLDASALPALADGGVRLRLIVGTLFGQTSPVPTLSPTFLVDAELDPGAALPLGTDYAERAAYVLSGEVTVAGERYGALRLLLFRPGDAITLRATAPTRLVLLGGEPLDGPRHLWWNFVSSRADRIEAAKADWAAGRFPAVPDESEFLPLPAG